MRELDGGAFFQWGAALHPLTEIAADTPSATLLTLMDGARRVAGSVLGTEPQIELAIKAAEEFRSSINHHWPNVENSVKTSSDVDLVVRLAIKNAAVKFENVLTSGLAYIHTYYLPSTRSGYNTKILFFNGSELFNGGLAQKVPDAIPDVEFGTKCIALDLPTAAAFHLHRAMETVLRKYFICVTNNTPPPSVKTMGSYVTELKKCNAGSPGVLAALRDLIELYRNPVAHPEHTLEDTDEAVALLGMIKSTMFHMLQKIP